MTNKLYNILTKPSSIKADIKRMQERIDDLRLMMLPSAIRYDKDKVVSSPSDPMSKYIINLEKYELKQKKLMDQYVEARDTMIELIDRLEIPCQRDVIQYRFMNGLKFYEIAEEIQYSEAQTYRIYADAIEALEALIKDDSE